MIDLKLPAKFLKNFSSAIRFQLTDLRDLLLVFACIRLSDSQMVFGVGQIILSQRGLRILKVGCSRCRVR